MRQAMISLCDLTTVMAQPWADAGYLCFCVDVQHPPGEQWEGNIARVGADIRDWTPPEDVEVVFVATFPPCTHLAVSGARWWEDKEEAARAELGLPPDATPVFDAAMELVYACRDLGEATGAPWFVENPVGRIGQRWRGPDLYFHPWQYGGYEPGADDGYTKKTGLWTGGGFVMPPPRPVALADDHNRIHYAPPSPERANIRSATPRGFARAVFEWNHPGAVVERAVQLSLVDA